MDRSTWYQVGVALFGILTVVCSFMATYETKREQKAKDAQPPQWATETTMELKRLGGQLGNRDATQDYLDLQRKLTQQYSGEMASVAVDRFMGSKADRQKLRNSIETANQQASSAARMRIQPVNDLFLGLVDAWVRELEKRGIQITYSHDDKDYIVGAGSRGENYVVRRLSLHTGAEIRVYMLPGAVEDGQFARPFQIAIQYMPKGGNDGYQCNISVYATSYQLENEKPHRYTFESYNSTQTTNPADDPQFVKRVRIAVDQIMNYLIGLNTD